MNLECCKRILNSESEKFKSYIAQVYFSQHFSALIIQVRIESHFLALISIQFLRIIQHQTELLHNRF
jgi:hypothetical protein